MYCYSIPSKGKEFKLPYSQKIILLYKEQESKSTVVNCCSTFVLFFDLIFSFSRGTRVYLSSCTFLVLIILFNFLLVIARYSSERSLLTGQTFFLRFYFLWIKLRCLLYILEASIPRRLSLSLFGFKISLNFLRNLCLSRRKTLHKLNPCYCVYFVLISLHFCFDIYLAKNFQLLSLIVAIPPYGSFIVLRRSVPLRIPLTNSTAEQERLITSPLFC